MITKGIKRDFTNYENDKGNPIKIAIIDDQHLLREGLGELLESTKSVEIVAVAKNTSVPTTFYKDFFPDAVDVLLIDLGNIPKESIDFIETFVKTYPTVKVIAITYHCDETYVLQSIRAGVSGYMIKEMDVASIYEVVQHVAVGGFYIHPKVTQYMINEYLRLKDRQYLGTFRQKEFVRPIHLFTKRECEVLQLLATAKTTIEIANLLCLSDNTVKNHLMSIFKKMKVETRTAAVVTAVKNGWVKIS
ncbi:response regulator transcription factor [Sporosarcina sp. JAI121]|uniref:response regulator transcription factor n=1 Tax=Sporosarcina sp. JAI121 TaxID=2723064 RepID=UPI0015CCEBC6|nr:response regulator transcription factor [Sporosarcina sp. JAI121]NYF23633.1 two-component system response regulator DegU [Sporosarcina sp. JAI121]